MNPKILISLVPPLIFLYLVFSSFKNWKKSLLQRVIFIVSILGSLSMIWSLYQLIRNDQFTSIGAAVLYALALFLILPGILVIELIDIFKDKSAK